MLPSNSNFFNTVFGLLVFACFAWAHKKQVNNVKSTLNAVDFVPKNSLYDSVEISPKIVPFQQQ